MLDSASLIWSLGAVGAVGACAAAALFSAQAPLPWRAGPGGDASAAATLEHAAREVAAARRQAHDLQAAEAALRARAAALAGELAKERRARAAAAAAAAALQQGLDGAETELSKARAALAAVEAASAAAAALKEQRAPAGAAGFPGGTDAWRRAPGGLSSSLTSGSDGAASDADLALAESSDEAAAALAAALAEARLQAAEAGERAAALEAQNEALTGQVGSPACWGLGSRGVEAPCVRGTHEHKVQEPGGGSRQRSRRYNPP
jgi:hypothetical protein